ncbi:MAG: RING finger protein [Planctomycetota bacterium]
MFARCPYCFMDLDAREAQVVCSRCSTPHHHACFLEHGRCVTLMCGSIQCRTVAGLELEVKPRLTVVIGPARSPFMVRGGYVYGDPSFLDVEALSPELARVAEPSIEVGLAVPSFAPGDEVIGQVSLHLPTAIRARGVRLVLRSEQTAPGSIVPKTLLEREALLGGFVWEGHLRALGLAARRLLHMDREEDLLWLVGGITRWTFRFRLDPLHPVRSETPSPLSVVTELLAYVDIPAAPDIVGRTRLPIVRPKP